MNFNEIIIGNMLYNSTSKSKSLNEGLQIVLLTCLFTYISNIKFPTDFFRNLFNFNKTNKLIFLSSQKESSKRYRAIMNFISKKNDISIKELVESVDIKYCYQSD